MRIWASTAFRTPSSRATAPVHSAMLVSQRADRVPPLVPPLAAYVFRRVAVAPRVRVPVPGVSVSTFDYDYIGRRVRKTVDVLDGSGSDYSVAWVYSGWNKVEERKTIGSPMTVKSFVWGLDLSQSMAGAGGIGGCWPASMPTAFGAARGRAACAGARGGIEVAERLCVRGGGGHPGRFERQPARHLG
jgi:hypothetical protein